MMRCILTILFSFITLSPTSLVFAESSQGSEALPRYLIDTSRLGVNAFANDARFGSAASQFDEVRSTLRLKFVRILIGWDSLVQPTKSVFPDFSFFDIVVGSVPPDMDALLVLTGVPEWMGDPANWTNGDPRTTFIEEWLRPVVDRYGANQNVVGFQVWNEPNQENFENQVMGFTNDPEGYVDMLRRSAGVIKNGPGSKLVVTAATTAIDQNFPFSLNYNRRMRDAGVQQFADVWAIHYYGRHFESVVAPGGVRDFANGLALPIWVTESGAQGVDKQLEYGEQVWPFLRLTMPSIQRIYIYQFTEATPPDATYGLRNLSTDRPYSDLYIWLRDRS